MSDNLSRNADWSARSLRFSRHHTGIPINDKIPPLRPILRDTALAAFLLAAGGWLMVKAPTADVALCGLIVAAGGLALAWWVGDQIARDKSPVTQAPEAAYKGPSLASVLPPSEARRRSGGGVSSHPRHPHKGAADA